ncbi:NADase-type glycan-binding domain-containing protein [Roseibacillus ishigakijimensis]|uniref:NAD glycohydrolase translocation F5/8 type C domain-containing protein n=1 Tax=Roseibacillus ishigakijimensis TaxID=454146 RepID=A0A934VKX2_9BACT|nr:hypothetical protein [Roseibacillus ishigakijimensis]MBK1834094.1 hypothetical protein [Roseibacillus ishigakijimensis]
MPLVRITQGFSLFFSCACSHTEPKSARADPHGSRFSAYQDDHGNPLGCSWYCGAPPIRVSATSTFHDGNDSYSPDNAHDSRKGTVWVEGAEGAGIGEKLIFAFDLTEREEVPQVDDYEFGIDSVSLINGFAQSEQLWRANGRVKALRILFDGKDFGTIEIEDTPEPRWIDLPKMVLSPGRIHEVAFEIVEVYPGDAYEDTALADFYFSGFGVH